MLSLSSCSTSSTRNRSLRLAVTTSWTPNFLRDVQRVAMRPSASRLLHHLLPPSFRPSHPNARYRMPPLPPDTTIHVSPIHSEKRSLFRGHAVRVRSIDEVRFFGFADSKEDSFISQRLLTVTCVLYRQFLLSSTSSPRRRGPGRRPFLLADPAIPLVADFRAVQAPHPRLSHLEAL